MPEAPDVIKLFHEEPFFLEPLPPDDEADARRRTSALGALGALLPGDTRARRAEDARHRLRPYYRGYLAGTDLAGKRVGATAIRRPDVWAGALVQAFGAAGWWAAVEDDIRAWPPARAAEALIYPEATTVLVAAATRPPEAPLRAVASGPRREVIPELKALLDQAEGLLLREPAHHGFDWTVLSGSPLRERLKAALAERKIPGVRIFSIPFQKARTEERFYFEQWALEEPPPWAAEVGGPASDPGTRR